MTRTNARWITAAVLGTALLAQMPFSVRAEEPGGESLEWVDEYLNAGRYKEAVEILRKNFGTAEKGSPRWQKVALRLAGALRIIGGYKEALGICEDAVKASPKDAAALGLLGEMQTEVGQYEEALGTFNKIVEADAENQRAWGLRVRVAKTLGQKELVKKTSDHFFELFNAKADAYHAGNVPDPMEMAYVGLGIQDENPKDAFEVGFMLAEKFIQQKGIKNPEAFLWSAELAFDKYAFGYAGERYAAVLKFRPKLPDALAGTATVLMAAQHDIQKAQPLLKEALEINPNHIGARLTQATIEFTQERDEEARKHIEAALATNPNHLEALAYLAFYYHFTKQPEKMAEVEKKVIALNPRCANFYYQIGELIEEKHGFDEAPAYYQKAIDLDPENWRGFYGLGMNTSRQGAQGEEKGKQLLLKAFGMNRFNPWANNMIKVLDKFIGDKDQAVEPVYLQRKTEHFTIAYHKKEAEIVQGYLEDWAESAYKDQAKRFGFEPQGPLTVSLCFTSGDQAARTVGIPVGGILGVCFGKLCTVLSPREGGDRKATPAFNWRKVLDHEYAHVMALQMSKFRVPLWFTEALSTFVENDSRLNTDQLIVNLYYKGQLKPIEKMQEYIYENRILAYVHGRFVIEYLNKEFGFEAVTKALKLFSEGKTLEQALTEVTGKTLPEMNQGVENQVKEFLKKVRLRPTYDPADLAKLEAAASSAEAPAQAIADLAIAHLAQNKLQMAVAGADKALQKDPKCVDALNLKGVVAMQNKDYAGAQKFFIESTQIDPERSFTAWHRLGVIYKKEGRTTKAIEALEMARKLYPRYVGPDNPYYLLPELYTDLEPAQNEKAMQVWLDSLDANTDDAEAAEKGLKFAIEIKDWKSAARCAERHMEINPYKPEIHKLAGRVFVELKDLPRAIREYRVVVALDDKDVESLVKLGRLHFEQGNREEAGKAVRAALEIDATDEGAKTLRKDLGL
ncbi:MAG: tetratricopeptide repeat protein [Planctomycetota bacterium]|nr:tetratricopeptide repeat protein [Planctomycetota bacterium]